MRKRAKGPQRGGDSLSGFLSLVRSVCSHYCDRCRECISDVVLAEQREIPALEKRRTQHDELVGARIKARFRVFTHGKRVLVASDISRHPHHRSIVVIYHPHRVSIGVREQTPLVSVILFDARVPVEVIRTQIRQHADHRFEARRIVQLEGGHLERNPFRCLLASGYLGERRSNVAGFDRLQVEATQKVSYQGSRRSLTVGSGDGDDARFLEKVERHLDLACDRDAVVSRKR